MLFDNGSVVPLTITRCNYILAHYTPADLSMLRGFEELKNNLSIVSKSFVTLGKPLKYEQTFVHIRDTKLIAPAGLGSLKALGTLYENDGDFVKRTIGFDDVNNMDEFLKRDKQAFEDYAIQDAVITLKHALEMERFNMGIKKLGVPLTLSSIGRKYVLEE